MIRVNGRKECENIYNTTNCYKYTPQLSHTVIREKRQGETALFQKRRDIRLQSGAASTKKLHICLPPTRPSRSNTRLQRVGSQLASNQLHGVSLPTTCFPPRICWRISSNYYQRNQREQTHEGQGFLKRIKLQPKLFASTFQRHVLQAETFFLNGL